MKIRIYETDFDGRPVDCSGEYFSGKTALDIVEGMTMNPFQNHLSAQEFMGQLLATIGEKSFSLPEDPETAALAFLQKLTALGYAEFAIIQGYVCPAQQVHGSFPDHYRQKWTWKSMNFTVFDPFSMPEYGR